MSRNAFDRVLAEFKAQETPEAILVVGDDQWMTRLPLAWPNVSLTRVEPSMAFSKDGARSVVGIGYGTTSSIRTATYGMWSANRTWKPNSGP